MRRRPADSGSGAGGRGVQAAPAAVDSKPCQACPSCARICPASWHEFGNIPEPAYALAETEALLVQATAAAP